MGDGRHVMERGLSRGLGAVSLGIGLAELSRPGGISRLSGVGRWARARAIVPALGVRELGHAAGLLAGRRPDRWVWTRVAGDAIDLSLLGRALAHGRKTDRRRAAVVTGAVAGITAVDVYAALRLTRARRMTRQEMRAEVSVTVRRPPAEVYRFWHDLENLPTFMADLESVRTTGERRSHWTAKAPGRRTVEWDAEIVEDRPDELIAWRTVDGADLRHSGAVRFRPAPGDRGTEIRVEMEWAEPAGRIKAAVAKLLGAHPHQRIRDDLRRFKQVMEAGEVVRSDGSPEGLSGMRQVRQRPGQPHAMTGR
jgi:uncharacterized membrane protein